VPADRKTLTGTLMLNGRTIEFNTTGHLVPHHHADHRHDQHGQVPATAAAGSRPELTDEVMTKLIAEVREDLERLK
jgi:hypothetical protein